MIILKSEEEIQKVKKSAKIVAEVLTELESLIKPGVSTFELDRIAEDLMKKKRSKPAFKGYRGYPCVLCTSVNEVIVHGIPSQKVILQEGDIIGVDCGVVVDGFYGDAAKTFGVGKVSAESEKLMKVTQESMMRGIEKILVGNRIHDISWAVQECAEAAGFSVVKEFVGHGVGRSLHEEPQIPNFGTPHTGIRLTPGMVLAIEPMVNLGTDKVKVLKDGWTAVTVDGRRSAHFEHTVALRENGYEILSILN